MQASKVKVVIEIEVLDIDAIGGIARSALDQIKTQFENGSLVAADGDSIKWKTTRTPVAM